MRNHTILETGLKASPTTSPTVIARVYVDRVWRPCPTFARIAFRGADLEEFGTPGHTFDQRIKVLFPTARGHLPDLSIGTSDSGMDWYTRWLALPDAERGAIRTYSIRDIRVDGANTEVVVDFVLHTAPGTTGPASRWAETAAPGDEVVLVGPKRGRLDGGGIEFAPAGASRVLLAGDETAAPAIARILEDAEPDMRGDAFIELPGTGEPLPIAAPKGVRVHWLGRDLAQPGSLIVPAVIAATGARDSLGGVGSGGDSSVRSARANVAVTEVRAESAESAEPDNEGLVWETPVFSASGEPLESVDSAGLLVAEQPFTQLSAHERYYWIAGESRFVTALRRYLVRDLGVPRGRVAFMGYWREGIAMK